VVSRESQGVEGMAARGRVQSMPDVCFWHVIQCLSVSVFLSEDGDMNINGLYSSSELENSVSQST
jgi:hypothetical protein